MNSLAQLGQQLLAIWKQLGLNQRISVILATLLLFGGLGGIVFWSNRVDYALLYGKLEDGEAAKVISALDDAKVPYRTGAGGGSIYVPSDKVHTMRMQLAGRGIPRGEGVGFEIFDKPNFGISDFVQRANYIRAVQGELSRTISELDEVETARVMIVMPENRLLNDNTRKPTASVFVKVKGQSTLAPPAVNSIRFLVANAVEGLQVNNVSVVDNRGNVLSENSESDSLAGLSTTQLAAQKNLELYLARKAEGMLETVLGPGQAVVRVAAEINFDSLTRTEEKFDPDGQVVRISTINDENTDTMTATTTSGGVPGTSTNSSTETNSVAATPLNNSKLRKKVVNNQYEINKTTSNLVTVAGGLKRLSAAVFVAAKVEGTGSDRKVVPRTDEELKRLKKIVQSALGIQEETEITLEQMPFNDQLGVELTQQLDTQQKRQYWFELAGSLALPGVGLAVLFFFWRAFRNTPVETIPIGVPLGQLHANGNGHGNGYANGHGNGNGNGHGLPDRKATPPGVLTVEVLNQLVRENPNNMSQAIRTWMSRGRSAQN
ncbi:MAG: flagellar basal-body MS-ring/collar protein FliF [Verrucomicrobiota bacterium]|jgi:flagellar M-ring protein FliF